MRGWGEKEGGKGKRGENGESVHKLGFWNVAGLRNKDKDFWEDLKEWDVVILSEKWVDKGGWDKIKDRLPKGYTWEAQWASRDKRKGRAKGGMVIGVKKGVKVERVKRERGMEGLLVTKVCPGGVWWKMIGVYVNKDLEVKLQALREWIEEREEGVRVIIGGGF